MAGIRQRDTKPELALRRALHARALRFRVHSSTIHGRPDIVLARHQAVVFVHGCFWHRHEGCRYTTTPSTRPEFWQEKFEANVARDGAVRAALLKTGWRVAVAWECALRKPTQVGATADLLAAWILSDSGYIELGEDDIEGLAYRASAMPSGAPESC